jgi:hypothetical protein
MRSTHFSDPEVKRAYLQSSNQNAQFREWPNGQIYFAIGFSIASIDTFLPDRAIRSVWV